MKSEKEEKNQRKKGRKEESMVLEASAKKIHGSSFGERGAGRGWVGKKKIKKKSLEDEGGNLTEKKKTHFPRMTSFRHVKESGEKDQRGGNEKKRRQ